MLNKSVCIFSPAFYFLPALPPFLFSLSLYFHRLSPQREMELQRLLDEASDRESANRQENLRLQRLTDQLHMQKKDLDHQRFDLENFGGDMSEEKKAELRER